MPEAKEYSLDREMAFYRSKQALAPSIAAAADATPNLRAAFLDPEALFKGKRVLDVGAGGCIYTRAIAQSFAPRSILAVDIYLGHPEYLLLAEDGKKLDFALADAFHMPFPDGSFDVAFFNLVLVQMRDLTSLAKEVRRILAPGGHVLAIEPSPWNPKHLYRYVFGKHSPNQYVLRPGHLEPFRRLGFRVSVGYSYRGQRRATPFLASTMSIVASRDEMP